MLGLGKVKWLCAWHIANKRRRGICTCKVDMYPTNFKK